MIRYVITNNGDGSSSLIWVTDPAVHTKIQEMADDGDEAYASGDGLNSECLKFPEGFDLEAWLKMNHISVTTMEDLE